MRYVIRLWLITALLSPILWVAALLLLGIARLRGLQSALEEFFPLFFFGGLLVSLPVFCAFYLFYSMITMQEKSVAYKKILLSLVGVLLIAITFFIIDSSMFTSIRQTILLCLLSYVTSFVGGIWVFKLPPAKPVI